MSLLGYVVVVALIIIALAIIWSRTLAALYPEKIRTAEVDHITTSDDWKLRMCRYRKDDSHGEPVLLVHGLNANQNNFTCPAGGCLVDYLSDRGYDCWTLDLRGTRSSQPASGQSRNTVEIEDFVWRDLPAAIDHIQKVTGYAKVHYIGHSLGGLLLYAYAQAMGSAKIASGTTLGAPVQFTAAKSVIPGYMMVLVRRIPWIMGEMLRCVLPFAKLFGCRISAFPINLANVPASMGVGDFYTILDDPAPAVHAQVFAWANRGEITLRQDSLNVSNGFSSMKLPLLAVFAPLDPFVPILSAEAFFESVAHKDKKMLVCSRENGCSEDYGHCDLAFGREGAQEVFEPITQWMKTHPCAAAPAAKPAPATEVKAAAPKKAEVVEAVPAKVEKAPAPKKAAAVKKPAAAKAAPAKAAPAKAAPAKAAAAPKKPAAKKPAAGAKPAAARKTAAAPKKAAAKSKPTTKG